MKIIGIELRLRYVDSGSYGRTGQGQQNREIAIIPCDIELEVADTGRWNPVTMNMTIHTDLGDVNVPDFQFPTPTETSPGLKFRSR